MKKRQGLVSNSSSCSFTLAVLPYEDKTEEDIERIEIIKAIINVDSNVYVKAGRLGTTCKDITEFKITLENEIELLKLDLQFAKKRTETLESLVDNQKALDAWVEMVHIDNEYRRLAEPRMRAQRARQIFDEAIIPIARERRTSNKLHEPPTTVEEFRARIRWADDTKAIELKKEEYERLLEKVNNLPEDCEIIYLHQDNFGRDRTQKILQIFEDKNWAVVVDSCFT